MKCLFKTGFGSEGLLKTASVLFWHLEEKGNEDVRGEIVPHFWEMSKIRN